MNETTSNYLSQMSPTKVAELIVELHELKQLPSPAYGNRSAHLETLIDIVREEFDCQTWLDVEHFASMYLERELIEAIKDQRCQVSSKK